MSETPLTRFLSEQTVARLREMRSALRGEIEQAHGHLAELEGELRLVETAISEKPRGRGGKRPATPVMPREPGSGRSMKDEIIDLMRERATEAWTTQDILDGLDRRKAAPGGDKPLNTVGNRLLDLAKAKRVYRVGRGTYSLTPNLSLIPNDEAGESN